MPNTLRPNGASAATQTKCVASVLLIAIETSDITFARYSTKTITVNGVTYLGRITRFNGVTTQTQNESSATAGGVSFSIGNTSTQGIAYEGKRCFVYQYFPNSADSRPTEIFNGVVAGPAAFDEATGETMFQAQANIHSNQVGYTFQSGQFGENNEQAAGQVWPKVFGKVGHVQGLLVQKQPEARLQFPIGFGTTISNESLFESSTINIESITETEIRWDENLEIVTFNDLDVSNGKIQLEDHNQFRKNEEIILDVSGVFFRGRLNDEGTFNVSQANLPKFDTINMLARPTENEAGVPEVDLKNVLVGWVDSDESLIDHYVEIELTDGDVKPDRDQFIELKVVHQFGRKVWFDKPLITKGMADLVDTGQSRTYSLIDENYRIRNVRLLNRLGLKVSVHSLLESIKNYQRGVKQTDTANTLDAITNRYDLIKMARNAFWGAEAGVTVRQVDGPADIYVVNDEPSLEVTGVYGELDGKLTPIPRRYYELNLDRSVNIPNGPRSVTTVQFQRPLNSDIGQNWSDQVFATVDSTLDNNPVNVIENLLTYTDLEPHGFSFNETRNQVESYPANFVLDSQQDAIQLIENIAFQSRIGVIVNSEEMSLKYLSLRPQADFTVRDRDILFGSVQLSSVNHRSIETSIRAIWTQNRNDQENIYENNIRAFGYRERQLDFFIYNEGSLVDKSARFWNYRRSNVWRTVRFTAFHRFCNVCVYDTIRFANSITPDSLGVVTEVRNRVVDGMVEITCELPIRQGQISEDSSYWITDGETEPVNPSNIFVEREYDIQQVDHGRSLDEMVENLKEFRAKQKVFIKVRSVQGDLAIVDTHTQGLDQPPSEVGRVATIVSPGQLPLGDNIGSFDRNGELYVDNVIMDNCRWVRIVSSNPVAEFENRWSYTGLFQDLKPEGTFTDNVAAEAIVFYSTMESGNTGSGIESSGDNLANFPPGVSIQPLGNNAIVRVCSYVDCFGGSVWLLENTPNNAGGNCQ